MTQLTLKLQPQAPLEAGAVTPDNFRGRSAREIGGLQLMHGNEPGALADFFEIDGDGGDAIILNGDLSRVKSIAAGMTGGSVTVNGNAGMHLGAGMHGGTIHVYGNVGDWTGAEMTGGKIHIKGNAGHGLGGAYRGTRRGMNRGLIIVEGNAGNEVGAVMRRGLIAVTGNVEDFAGAFMIAGSIIVFGRLGVRTGAGLLRGTIVTFQDPELLPTFHYDCRYRPDFLRLIFEDLRRHGLSIPAHYLSGHFRRFSGDFNRLGKGEILVYDQRESTGRSDCKAND
jgi:formylmethanofuran dehydrogenase subunit C